MVLAPSGNATRRPGWLPADTTSFLGRRRELAEVKRLLAASRLVTLVGVGGVGKTRLALRTAGNVRRAFHGRVWFVELADLRNPVLMAATVAEVIGIHDQSARPAVDLIISHLEPEPALLVLDNCEHLVEECAELVTELLRSLPELRVIATSRQSLGVLGEATMTVPPLPVPEISDRCSPETISRNDCVRLFAERAAEVAPKFSIRSDNYETLARLCRDLDGIPLAIELAAVRLRTFSLDQIVGRLTDRFQLIRPGIRDVPERQRTLRALIDWSYDLCPDREREVWARASVFSGSFDLDALEYVGDTAASGDILEVVDALVDKSIFTRDPVTGRYRMLDTIRHYGATKLDEQQYRAARRRHRDWYARLAARFEAEWIGPGQVGWIHSLRRDHPNLRDALDFCLSEPGAAVAGLNMATWLDDFWLLCGFHSEARHWLDRLLDAAPASAPERPSALRVNAWLATLQGDIGKAQSSLAEAVALARDLGNAAENAYLLHLPGATAFFSGDLDNAETLLTEALSGFQAAGVPRGELHTMVLLGQVLALNGERERGLSLLRECVERTSSMGEVYFQSWGHWAIAQIEVRHDELDRAETAAMHALSLENELENRFTKAFTLDTLAWIAQRRGKHTRAAELFGSAAALCDEIGIALDAVAPIAEAHHEHIASARAALGETAYDLAFRWGGHQQVSPQPGSEVKIPEQARPERLSPQPSAKNPLTRRESEIATLVAQGLTNKDIAARLVISQRTAEAHVEHILTKLGFTSRTQVAAWVTEHLPEAPA